MTEFPWNTGHLASWSIVGMNHYVVHNHRYLFVAMVKSGVCIKAEGRDEQLVFQELAQQAETAIIDTLVAAGRLSPHLDMNAPITSILLQEPTDTARLNSWLKPTLGGTVYNIRQVIAMTKRDILRIRNLGERSLDTLERSLAEHGLALAGRRTR